MHQLSAEHKKGLIVSAFVPDAERVWVIDARSPGRQQEMKKIRKEGFFELALEDEEWFPYRLKAVNAFGDTWEFHDPYSFPPVLSDFDLHLMAEGTHYRNYEKLGAHLREISGIRGTHFAVWAPNAKRVSIVGDFNHWDGRQHAMRVRGSTGIWEIFIPDLYEDNLYKFEIKSRTHDYVTLKTDPYGFYFERRPKTAAIVQNIDSYRWNDDQWVEHRAGSNALDAPISIYEVHLGSWMRVPEEGNRYLTYRELAHRLVDYVKEMGYTHIELLPVMEHPFDGSWGYQTIGYYAPTSRFGRPADFMYFVDYCHGNNIGVLLDWVPAHFPKDTHGLAYFDGTHLYEHADPRKGEHQDWGTLIFNYGRNEVQNFLLGNALFWVEKYHVDGLRVDAVASMLYLDYSRQPGEWLPNALGGNENLEAINFIKRFNVLMHGQQQGVITAAEESTAWPMVSRPTYAGGLGFGFKWNMGWMNDTLLYMSKDPIHRKYHHSGLSFSLIYAFNENFILPLSHDEVVHGKRALLDKMPGDSWKKFANLRLLYAYMYGHPGKKLLFMGGEFGQWNEWAHDRSLDWHLLRYESHQRLQRFIKDLNRMYRSEPALYEIDFEDRGFEWIDFHDWEGSTISFIRKGKDSDNYLIFVLNFTPVPRLGYRVGVPEPAFYVEILNSDSAEYGGSNMGNLGGIASQSVEWSGRPYSLEMTLPPLAAVVLKPRRAL
ncbi:MAG TPA: 1,4-alpha-glucan branching protein GlgB [Acidobacteriota bacterium]|jgi:1,4-alpha-glucan branching enzyme|nr:1,4-alpha-glucan branching protein GlgB [Acidobacteriota bacterium]